MFKELRHSKSVLGLKVLVVSLSYHASVLTCAGRSRHSGRIRYFPQWSSFVSRQFYIDRTRLEIRHVPVRTILLFFALWHITAVGMQRVLMSTTLALTGLTRRPHYNATYWRSSAVLFVSTVGIHAISTSCRYQVLVSQQHCDTAAVISQALLLLPLTTVVLLTQYAGPWRCPFQSKPS